MQPTNKAKEKYKKAPTAPRRFKTAYMFFSIEKQKEIRGNTEEKVRNQPVESPRRDGLPPFEESARST
jgi:hypothetical protein